MHDISPRVWFSIPAAYENFLLCIDGGFLPMSEQLRATLTDLRGRIEEIGRRL
jgi:hypothetical protein